jgi:hypothetical protein
MTEKEKIWLASLSVATIGLATLIVLYRREIKSGILSSLSSLKNQFLILPIKSGMNGILMVKN